MLGLSLTDLVRDV
jgi:hypothetical protein